MFKHLVDIKNLTKNEVESIIARAEDFESGAAISRCSGKQLCLLFCENSTRTRFSFEVAANKLGLHVHIFDADKSSFTKGESLKDTLENLSAIGIDAMVIRHKDPDFIDSAVKEVTSDMAFINAGTGNHSHPTQALLDFYTMKKHLGDVAGKKIVIIGDIKHSRVAHSNAELLQKFGAEIHFCAPDYFRDDTEGVIWDKSLEQSLCDADVAMFLRIQKERLEENVSLEGYVKSYGLTLAKLKDIAPRDILVMHPGPVNRGIELSDDVMDSDFGKTILEQAHNGVFVRMGVLDLIFGGAL